MICNIRDVRPEQDAKAIADIYRFYVEKTTVSFELKAPDCKAMLSRIIDITSNYPYLVYEDNGQILGYCYVHQWKERPAYKETLETTIYLATNAVGRGIGHHLMKELIARCKSQGYHSLIACITAENKTSCLFHENLGFKKVSHFKSVGFKLGRYLDVVDYQYELSK